MSILISKTFAVYDDESAETGEPAEQGFVFEDVPYTFGELVHLLREYDETSESPCSGGVHVWVTNRGQDYFSGEETEESLHYSRNNPPCNAKYWAKALKCAGLQ